MATRRRTNRRPVRSTAAKSPPVPKKPKPKFDEPLPDAPTAPDGGVPTGVQPEPERPTLEIKETETTSVAESEVAMPDERVEAPVQAEAPDATGPVAAPQETVAPAVSPAPSPTRDEPVDAAQLFGDPQDGGEDAPEAEREQSESIDPLAKGVATDLYSQTEGQSTSRKESPEDTEKQREWEREQQKWIDSNIQVYEKIKEIEGRSPGVGGGGDVGGGDVGGGAGGGSEQLAEAMGALTDAIYLLIAGIESQAGAVEFLGAGGDLDG